MSLTRIILDAHAVPGRANGMPPAMAAVRPDLLLADRETARMALGRFAALAAGPVSLECLVTSDLPGIPAWSGLDPAFADFARQVLDCGARLVPPRTGDRGGIALESLSAPGRLFATLGPAPEAGALGALALQVGELEALALLGGEPLELDTGAARRIELTGVLPSRCDGLDVAGALIAEHAAGFAGLRLDMGGDGVATLTIADRVVICRALAAAGAASVLFPSDDSSREFLRGRGRESDWRRTDPGPGAAGAIAFDLGWTVPHAISCARPARAIPLAWWSEVTVSTVAVGPGLTLESLAYFAALLRQRHVHPDVVVRVMAWCALDGSATEAEGLRRGLAAAGATWIGEAAPIPRGRSAGSLRLCCGAPVLPAEAGDDDWWVSVPAAAEAACRGRIDSPQHWPDSRDLAPVAGPLRLPIGLPLRTSGTANGERDASTIPHPGPDSAPAPWRVSPARALASRVASRLPGLRGPVLGRIDGDLDGDALLPYGPKLSELRGQPERLAEHVVPAARHGGSWHLAGVAGGWLLVRGNVHDVERREAGLLALAALGVRGVLAAGFEPRARVLFSRAGLLALSALRAGDLDSIQPGDELELVGGLEAFAADRARVMRDLTRGFALVVLPEQSRREWSWVGAGGVARPAESGSLAC